MKILFILCLLSMSLAKSELVFDKIVQELHAAADATDLTCDFDFENKGNQIEEILSHDTNCTCISAQLSQGGKRIYAPGEKGTLRTIFAMGNFSGSVDKNVIVRLKGDSGTSEPLTLTVRIHIPVLVELSPKNAEWTIDEPKNPKKIKVVMNDVKPIKLTQVTSSNTDFQVHFTTVQEGKEYEITVTPSKPETKTPSIAVIRVETDCVNEKQKSQMGFALIRMADPDATKRPAFHLQPSAIETPQ